MAYIGNIPAEKFTSVDIQNFTVSATANYTLDRPVANENEIELFINNVRQHPGSGKAYTASGTALTLSEATAGTDTMYCVYQGKARQTVTPATSSVTNAMLAGSIDLTSKVTGALPQANIADQAINEAKLQISNAPTNGYMLTAQSGNTGGLTWAEAPSGGFVRTHGSANQSPVSTVTLDNAFSSTYRTYKVIGHIGTDQSDYIKYRTRSSSADNNGDQYINSERYNFIDSGENQSTGDYGHHTTTFGFLAFAGIATNSAVTGSYCAFDLTFHNPHTDDGLTRHMMTGQIVYRNAGTQKMYGSQVYSTATSNHNAEGIKFECNAGNVEFHRIDIYGMVNS